MKNQLPSISIGPHQYADSKADFLWRMSVETYHQLIDLGTFQPDDQIELIHGYLVKKMPKNRRHAQVTQALLALISQIIGFGKGWFLSVQDPITLQESEPEPDIAVIRGSYADYSRHPGPSDVGVVIEVSDSSLDYDVLVKKEMYALDKVSQYWVVNLKDRQIEVFTDPFNSETHSGYRQQAIYLDGDVLPLVLDNVAVGQLQIGEIFVS